MVGDGGTALFARIHGTASKPVSVLQHRRPKAAGHRRIHHISYCKPANKPQISRVQLLPWRTMSTYRSWLMAPMLASALLAPGLARAETASTGFDFQVGGMVFVAPKFEGSKDYEVMGVPFIAPAGRDGDGMVQFRGPDDLRFRLLRFGGFEAGPLAGWRFGRDEEDADRLEGLGDVDGGVVVGGFAAYKIGNFKPFVSYHHQVSGDATGGLTRFGLEAQTLFARAVVITGTVGATYADSEFMESYFSVTDAQRAASVAGLDAFDAGSGIKDVYFGLSGDVPLNDVWTLKVTGRYSRLTGDAADSPIIESEDQLFGGLGVTYRFSR